MDWFGCALRCAPKSHALAPRAASSTLEHDLLGSAMFERQLRVTYQAYSGWNFEAFAFARYTSSSERRTAHIAPQPFAVWAIRQNGCLINLPSLAGAACGTVRRTFYRRLAGLDRKAEQHICASSSAKLFRQVPGAQMLAPARLVC